jgi:hypothetical protein
MSGHIGLYYPFIHFRDESWLKLTSLYWDRMGRIVPEGYGLRDNDTVRQFKDSGYVRNSHPGGAQARPGTYGHPRSHHQRQHRPALDTRPALQSRWARPRLPRRPTPALPTRTSG